MSLCWKSRLSLNYESKVPHAGGGVGAPMVVREIPQHHTSIDTPVTSPLVSTLHVGRGFFFGALVKSTSQLSHFLVN